ncbi:hypothetical protein C0991_007624 [Blastosporella zonata]|nr:hypothetical protein C0991_007624 [Blastosporella zonata]
MTSTDALLILRQTIKAKEPIKYTDSKGPCSSLLTATHILASSVSLSKSSPTRYLKTGVTTPSGPSDFFSVEAVYIAWLLRDAGGAEYMKQARENGLAVGFVSVTERKNVVDWLEGRTLENSRIVPLSCQYISQAAAAHFYSFINHWTADESTTPPGTPPRTTSAAPVPTRRPHAEPMAASPSKRRYIADAHDVDIVKKIKQGEVELRDRNTVLRGTKPNNFSSIRTVYAEKLKKMREASKNGAVPPPVVSTADAKLLARKARAPSRPGFSPALTDQSEH